MKKAAKKPTKKPAAPKLDTVTIRGVANTLSLREGEIVTVQRTPTIDGLLAEGWVEEVHRG